MALNLPRKAVIFCLLLVIISRFGNAATLRVNGPQDSIQNVIAQAANGDTVVVSSGVYTQTFNFAGKSLKVTSESGPANTIIIATPSAPPNPVYAIGFSTETRTAELSGFTIANSVGGIVIQAGASPTIRGNIITNCDEGILCFGSPLISSNKITGSKVNAMRLIDLPAADVEDNLIEKNNAGVTGNTGGGSVFQRNIFRRNTGSAVAIHFGDMDFVDNQFIENDGHAILVDIGVNQRVRVLHNLFLNNGLVGGAAVTFSFGFATSVIANNIVVGDYGFVCVNGGSDPLPTVSGNNVVSSANHGYTGQLTDLTGQFGNISANPQFLNSSLGDYRLLATSPEIDHGDPSNSVNLDFVKTARPIDGDGDGRALPDIGPFEFSPGPPRPSTTLTAIAFPTSVSLTWTPFDLATGYQVLRGPAPEGPFETIAEGNFTSYVDSDVTSGVIYFYSVAE